MSEVISVMYEGDEIGTATITREGLYCTVDCRCRIPSEEVLRAYVDRENGPLCLGVLVPEEGQLRLRRRFAKSGFPSDPSVVTVAGREGTWRSWSGELAGVPIGEGLTRTAGGVRQVAVPWEPDRTEAYLPFLRHCTPVEIQGRRYLLVEPDSLADL